MAQPPGDSLHQYTQQNRRAWNEIARVRSQGFPPAEFFALYRGDGEIGQDDRAADMNGQLYQRMKRPHVGHGQMEGAIKKQ